ncbi:MerR family transcriptional regulator [Paenibacillus puldeungensis]|uniref:MerR family transcriptional regulator n=1 Tax=Paenibacillus puldeungensis TaxID=696536 RepID=A0ABW3RXP1_9BACL
MNTYKTAEIAHRIGIHPNTVRLYEELGLIPRAKRASNGYRVFTDFHLEQIKFARTAMEVEIIQSGLRRKAIEIIKSSTAGDFDRALALTNDYLLQIEKEITSAEEAISIVERLLSGRELELQPKAKADQLCLTRQETADRLQITMDALRNWEMNGLLTVKRKQNGYRVYTAEDLQRLIVIRSLRSANYSLAAILRMLRALYSDPEANLREVIDTPGEDDDIVSVCDKLLTSLQAAETNALQMLVQLGQMKKRFGSNPTL